MPIKQIILKPQDLIVVLKVALRPRVAFTYASLAQDLGMSASQVHASHQRAQLARLVVASPTDGVTPIRAALREFVIHGAKYAFPAILGAATRGIPTAHAGPALRAALTQSDDAPPVWPYSNGSLRGMTLYPLYPNAPIAAQKDNALYDMLTLIDAIRIGAARERDLAEKMIVERLA